MSVEIRVNQLRKYNAIVVGCCEGAPPHPTKKAYNVALVRDEQLFANSTSVMIATQQLHELHMQVCMYACVYWNTNNLLLAFQLKFTVSKKLFAISSSAADVPLIANEV